jgi:hypothetical protein
VVRLELASEALAAHGKNRAIRDMSNFIKIPLCVNIDICSVAEASSILQQKMRVLFTTTVSVASILLDKYIALEEGVAMKC